MEKAQAETSFTFPGYEDKVLQRKLDGLDDEFNTLKFLAQELQMRANSIRFQKAA